jgi:FkbM family methyltransferase
VAGALQGPLAHIPLRGAVRAAYHRALRLSTFGRGLIATLPGGEAIRILPQYRYVTWNEQEYAAFKAALRPGHVAFDVGANVGCYTVLLGQLVSPGGRVFAFEPSPQAFRGLTQHIALNRLQGVAVSTRSAVADREGAGDFVLSGSTGTDRLASANEVPGNSVTHVTVVTLDDFCAREGLRPDFVKIDVEGAELAVLRGARRTIQATRDRLALFVEMHPSLWPTLGVAKEDLVAELERQSLRLETLTKGQDPWTVEGVCVRVIPR